MLPEDSYAVWSFAFGDGHAVEENDEESQKCEFLGDCGAPTHFVPKMMAKRCGNCGEPGEKLRSFTGRGINTWKAMAGEIFAVRSWHWYPAVVAGDLAAADGSV